MSSVKITQLPFFTMINANTANTIFAGVDIPTDTTFQMTAHTLAQGLYSNEILNVGGNPVVFSNTIAQFSGSDPTFLQLNLQNFNSNGSGDLIVTSDTGTNSNNYIDLGINGSTFSNPTYSSMKPLDAYLYVQGPTALSNVANLVIGTASYGANIVFIAGGTTSNDIIATINEDIITMYEPLLVNGGISFGDASYQNTAPATLVYSQASYAQANAATVSAQSGYNLANTVSTTANAAYLQANAATISAQSGYNLANTVSTTANAAYLQANAATVSAQSVYNLANTVSTTANASYLQANAATSSAQSGYNLANTVSTTANAAYLQANAATNSAQAAYNLANSTTATVTYQTGVNLQQNTNITAVNTYAASGYAQANVTVRVDATQNTLIGIIQGVDLTQNTNIALLQSYVTTANANIAAAFAQANSAAANTIYQAGVSATQNTTTQTIWNQVNTAVQNTSTIILNNLNLNGNLIANNTTSTANFFKVNILGNNNGSLTINNNSFSAQTALVKIIGSSTYASQTPINAGYMMQIVGLDNTPTRIVIDSASASGNAYGLIAGRTSRGSAAAPSAAQAGDVLMRFSGNGYGTTSYSPLGVARMDVVAAENFSDTNKGAVINFSVTRVGSNTVYANVVSIASNTVSFGTNNYTQPNTIIDMANSRIQVSNTGVSKHAYAISWIDFTPTYPNGSAGDKKGMMFLDAGNAIGNGVRLYWCNADYTSGAAQIWYTQTTGPNGTIWG